MWMSCAAFAMAGSRRSAVIPGSLGVRCRTREAR
jgi:hypothetical protein